MNRSLLHDSIISSVRLVFSRAGGKGGQNVNKVNTRVQAFVHLSALQGLTEDEQQIIKAKMASSMNSDGELFVAVADERTQERNREIALARLETNIVNASYIPPKRKKTKPTKASKEKRLQNKKIKSLIKAGRNWRSEY